jgi:hypothetical protein
MLLCALLLPISWSVAIGVEYLLFGTPEDENKVDFAGFVTLRPIFTAMLAFAGAVVAASAMIRLRGAKRGFQAQRSRP